MVKTIAADQDRPFGSFAPTPAQRAVLALASRSGLRRGAFRPMLSRLIDLMRAGPIDTHYQGASFRFHHQASATERGALLNPDYNLVELNFLRANTPVGGVFADLGANVGTFAIPLARHVGAGGTVIAVEPHPVTQARLAFNVAASGLRNVRSVAAAVSDGDGEVTIQTDADNLGASHVAASAGGKATGQAIAVPALRLVRILAEASATHVDALKIDIEGFEDRALIGFFRDAPENLWPRAVVIEHLSRDEWRDDCLADMAARGYVEAGKTRSNTLLLRG